MYDRKMLIAIITVTACVSILASTVSAQEDPAGRAVREYEHGDIAVGVIFGEPTGLSGKMWTTDNTGFDIGLAWSWSGDGHFHIHGDYLFHRFGIFDVSSGALPVYIGIGGRILFRDEADDKIGVRFSIGLEYFFEDWPLAVFGEVVPILDLAPSTEGEFNGGIGARFYF
jgi:hypothetical protein